MTCVDCKCKRIKTDHTVCEVLHEYNDSAIRTGVNVLQDADMCDWPKLFPKFLYSIWCLLKNIINTLCCYISNTNHNNREIYTYAKNLEIFNKEMMRALALSQSGAPGNTKAPVFKRLVFEGETGTIVNANMPNLSRSEYLSRLGEYKHRTDYPAIELAYRDDGWNVLLGDGDVFEVEYKLNNTRFLQKPVPKMKLRFYPASTIGNGIKVPLSVFKEPTGTGHMVSPDHTKRFRMTMEARFYDDSDNLIDIDSSAFAFNSLNGDSDERYEGVTNLNGTWIEINGSAVTNVNGDAHSRKDINAHWQSLPPLSDQWDSTSAPDFFVGSIAGIVNGPYLKVDLDIIGKNWMWFTLNTEIATTVAPEHPELPNLKTYCEV